LGRPSRAPLAFAAARPSLRPFCNEVPLHLGKQTKERNHGLGLHGVLALETNGLLQGDEANAFVD
jgi:hypothetical protein